MATSFPSHTLAEWRAQVEKELAGKPFDKVLVHETLEGIPISPLYTQRPGVPRALGHAGESSFLVCMRHEHGAPVAEIAADVSGGADALWFPLEDLEAIARHELANVFLVVDADAEVPSTQRSAQNIPKSLSGLLTVDPIQRRVQGSEPWSSLEHDIAEMGASWRGGESEGSVASALVASTLPYHDAGVDAVDEVALSLAIGARYVTSLLEADVPPAQFADRILLRVAVGRDTFVELCKLRALRLVWAKLMAASGAPGGSVPRVHAVCSSRTLAARDPWVNLLRVTTQVFSAVVGGADLVTPAAFDSLLETPSALGRRVARNTGLVLREESSLGRVVDAGAGSYYFDTLTDALARAAWERFRLFEREGGIGPMLEGGPVVERLEATRRARGDAIAKRKMPILGVSEFANLDEVLPSAPRADVCAPSASEWTPRRDAASFEALRASSDAHPREALLVTLGSPAEARVRAAFASSFFAAGGLRARETEADEKSEVACLCGTDERYATEAVARAGALKAAGCAHLLFAGRPGPLEADLRAAGVEAFIFVGCDVVAILGRLLEPSP